MKAYLAERAIFREKTPNRFAIHFTGREMNKALVIFRTVLHLKQVNAVHIKHKYPLHHEKNKTESSVKSKNEKKSLRQEAHQ